MESINITSKLMEQLQGYIDGAIAALPKLAIAIVVLIVTWIFVLIAKMIIRKVCNRVHLRQNLIDVMLLIAGVVIWLAGILIALAIVFPSITPGKALTTLGLGSVAIGFAFKDTFENFLAGILILLREPFQIGDYVEVDGHEGQIEHITIRDTRVRRTDGQLIVMPNHELFQKPVVVRTDKEVRRITVMCGVAYDEDVDESREVILNAVRQIDSVRDDVRDVEVFAQAFGASSIDFEVTWWTGSKPIDIRKSRDQVVAAVKRALDDAGIEIPFPYQTLTFKEPLPIMDNRESRKDQGGGNQADDSASEGAGNQAD